MNGNEMDPNGHDDELAQRLEAYARERLSPEVAATLRLRTAVMREAHRRLAPAASPEGGPATRPRVARRRTQRRGRIVPALLAAALALLALAGGALAARPGGPLYEARLALEELLLPPGGDARAAADLGRLEDRLGELVSAASSGDGNGVAAALAAYRELLDETSSAAGASDVRDAALEAAIAHHLDVLNELLTRVPEQARSGIEQAIERSGKAVEKIHAGGGPDSPPDNDPDPGSKPVGPTGEPPGQSNKPDRKPPGQSSDRPSRAP
jgi:hypothetical protein